MVHGTKDHIVGMNIETLYALAMNVRAIGLTQHIIESGTTYIACQDAHRQCEIAQKMGKLTRCIGVHRPLFGDMPLNRDELRSFDNWHRARYQSRRTESTGQGALRSTRSVVLPNRKCSKPLRPWVPIAMILIPWFLA